MLKKVALGLTTALVTASAASAMTATAATDLHLRAGPGTDHAILGKIAAKDSVTLEGCLEQSNWCRVSYNGQTGWAYGDYLATDLNGETVAVYPNRTKLDTVVIEDDMAHERGALAVGGMGAALGAAAIGGPAAIVVGGILGAAAGVAMTPEERMVTYVREHPVDPVFVQGELVVGGTVPQEVNTFPLPESELAYVNVNGRYVMIKPDTREIVYIADF